MAVRDKRRYVLVEASCDVAGANGGTVIPEFKSAIVAALHAELGEVRYHAVNPAIVACPGRRLFILRCSLDGVGDLITALALTRSLRGAQVGLYTLGSSGTIRALKDSLVEMQRLPK